MPTDPVAYRSRIYVERAGGPLKRVYLPVDTGPVEMGVHAEVAEHYGVDTAVHEPTASTLDYLIASVAACLTGTFGVALEGRGIPAGEGYLRTEAVGELETDDNVLVVRRIQVTYHLKTARENRAAAERVLRFHADRCATARSVRDAIEITTALEIEEA